MQILQQQLSLVTFDHSSGTKADLVWLSLDRLHPHPRNPRRGEPEKLHAIVESMKVEGYRPEKPMLVRPLGSDSYQIIGGHTRFQAAKLAGLERVLCVVEDMPEETAILRLAEDNRCDPFSWVSECIYVAQNSVRDSKKGLSRTALIRACTGKEGNAAEIEGRRKGAVGEFLLWLEGESVLRDGLLNPDVNLTKHLYAIHKAPQQYWQQLTELLIENDWSVRDTEAIVDAVNKMMALQCPDWLTEIVKFDRAVIAAIKGDDRIYGTMKSCINTALECHESLETITVEIVDGEELRAEDWDLKSMYIQALADTKNIHQNLTPGNFSRPCAKLKQQVEAINKQSSQWKRDRAEGAELERLKAEEQARRDHLIQEYKPEGILGDVKKVLPRMIADQGDTFDLVLTDPPYLLSNDGITARGSKQVSVNKNFDDSKSAIAPESWLPFCLQLLKPGGVLVFTCTEHLDISLSRLESHGFEFLERLFWIKRSAPPRLTPTGHGACIEEVWVCRKPGDTHTFNYDLLKDEYWDGKQASNYLEFEQCSGNERLGWHDTQKPLKLWSYLMKAYSPEGGKILDPFSGSGTTAVAAKALGRKCTWIEQSPEFFSKAEERIQNAPFHWEV